MARSDRPKLAPDGPSAPGKRPTPAARVRATRGSQRDLVPGEWAVLGLLAEAPAHGFALAKSLAADGDLGTIWTLSRPLVYRVLTVLEQPGLIRAAATESGPGPARTIMTITPVGRRVLEHWLAEPVDHVRDARSLLMLKLAFINRSGGDPRPMLERQRQVLTQRVNAHRTATAGQTEWQRTVELWRYESVQAVLRFTEQMLAGDAPPARSASGQ